MIPLRYRRVVALFITFMAAWRERAQARPLAELDPRTLKDIGLERDQISSLADRIEAHRHKALLRAFTAGSRH